MTHASNIEWIDYVVDGHTFQTVTIPGDGGVDAPSLVVLTSFSVASVNSTRYLLDHQSDTIRNRFNQIIIIGYPREFAAMQTQVFDGVYDVAMAVAVINLDVRLSGIVNNFLTGTLGLTNVCLLGKCAGAGLAIKMCARSPTVYHTLFIAHPASAEGIARLTGSTVRVVMVWNRYDTYPYKWGTCSNLEPYRYGQQAHALNLNFELHVVDGVNSEDSRDRHEIPVQIFGFM